MSAKQTRACMSDTEKIAELRNALTFLLIAMDGDHNDQRLDYDLRRRAMLEANKVLKETEECN